MSHQLAQLSEEEIEERFHIRGFKAILFSLDSYLHQRAQFTVHFNEGRESFLTYLLAVDSRHGRLVVDRSGSAEVNARFLNSTHSVFVGRPEGIKVQFACAAACRIEFEGEAAFSLPLPECIVRLQRRDCFRVSTPLARPILLDASLPGESGFALTMHDLSLAGCGLSTGIPPDGIEAGTSLPLARFTLPDSRHTRIGGSAVVRHVTALSTAPGPGRFRIGLQFLDLDRGMEHQIQRYIVQIEHDRRELLAR